MSKITSIATCVPRNKYAQEELFAFANAVYQLDEAESRKVRFLYRHSGITSRYSVLPDFNVPQDERTFFPRTADLEPFPDLESRMAAFTRYAPDLSINAIKECISGKINEEDITHLITVSCTGMSAPGLDLQIMEAMGLPRNIIRTSVNMMGCYAAVHALKLADAFCKGSAMANVIVVSTELCTLHFQKTTSPDSVTSALLFSDGCAAALIQHEGTEYKGLQIESFFSDVSFKGRNDMAWELSSKGFIMTLSGYVPDLIKEDFKGLAMQSLDEAGLKQKDITHWCIHPGGKKILEAIERSMEMNNGELNCSYDVLRDYGNMSSATILFVLKKILDEVTLTSAPAKIFGAAFGPGLTMETFIAAYD